MAKKILIAPDSFKDCLSAEEVARFLGEGIRQAMPDAMITLFPVADGGEGTASCIAFHRGGTWKELTVNDPLHRPVRAQYLVLEQEMTAVIELARASGLELLYPKERNALKTSTLGTGELIRDALESGLQRIILTIGGSATVDGGTGIAAALGFRFTDKDGEEIQPCGGNLAGIEKIETGGFYPPSGEKNGNTLSAGYYPPSGEKSGKTLPGGFYPPSGEKNGNTLSAGAGGVHPGLTDAEIIIACDVQNILNGPEGAARVYGPQKGADERAVAKLEKGLRNISSLVRQETGFDADKHPGTGAAGGAALFLMAYGRGVLKSGFEIVSGLTRFEEAIRESEIVITGEGRIDTQTAYGKVVASVAAVTSRERKPLIIVAGLAEGDRQVMKDRYGAAAVYSLMDIASGREDSISNAPDYLRKIGRALFEQVISEF